jgi:hypothetical protein
MTRRLLFASLAALGLSVAVLPASAGADTFTFVGSSFRSCWEDTEGFTAPPDLQPIPLPGGSPAGTHFLRLTSHSISATTIFNTTGTVTVTDNVATAIRNTTTGRVGSSQATCTGTWTFDPATQRVNTTSTCNVTDTIGDANTATVVSTQAIYRLAGTILVRIEPATPVVETVNVLTGTGAPFSYQRVCGFSGTLHLVQ